MRLHHGLALALWLSSLAAAVASATQEPAGAPNHGEQAPESAAPGQAAPAAQAPVEPGVTPSPSPGPETGDTKPAVNAPGAELKPATAEEKIAEEKEKKPAPPTNAARKRRKHTARAAPGTPRKIVVREGGASEPAAQIAPGMTPAEAVHQRQNAERWLGSTDEQLKQLAARTLDARQQETVAQIHNYMDGARSALKEGDVGRASTLAQKAHLLSDDLIKH